MRQLTNVILALFILIPQNIGFSSNQQAQSENIKIQVFNLEHQSISTLIDGNSIQLSIDMGIPVKLESRVDFLVSGKETPVESCVIKVGQSHCASVYFSTLGWYWNQDGSQRPQLVIHPQLNNQQIGGDSLGELEYSLTISVLPRPVVLVHGFNSTWQAWTNYLGSAGYLASLGLHGYAVGDGQVNGVLNTGSLSNPAARTNSIAENAVILGEYISNAQAISGAEKVDLLVHSMGGMIARYFIDKVMTTNNVAQLIILGTPMAGSACAQLPAALGILLPASLEIQPSYMTGVFNMQVFHRKGVPFHALAGTKLLDGIQSPCTSVPSDIVVSVESVKAIPMPVEELPLLHTELNTSLEVFHKFVTPLLKTSPGKFETAMDPAPGSEIPAEMQFTKTYTGHLDPGDVGEVSISIDPNVTVANFSLYDTSRSLEVKVTGASGKEIILDPVKNGLIQVQDPSTLVYLGYGFKQPKPGKWIVTLLTSAETPPEGADYAISANFTGGATISSQISSTVPLSGEVVTISAKLMDGDIPVRLESAKAEIRKPDGATESIDMIIHENASTLEIIPKINGIYGIQVIISARSRDGDFIDRAAYLSFEAQPEEQQITRNRVLFIAAGAFLILVVGFIVGRIRRRQ